MYPTYHPLYHSALLMVVSIATGFSGAWTCPERWDLGLEQLVSKRAALPSYQVLGAGD